MEFGTWQGKKSPSTTELSRQVKNSLPLRRSYSISDALEAIKEPKEFDRYRPWQQKYTDQIDDLWFYKCYNSGRNYPRRKFPEYGVPVLWHTEPTHTDRKFPKYKFPNFNSQDPSLWGRSYYNEYLWSSRHYFPPPSYYPTMSYNYSYKPYYSSSSWYHPVFY